MENKNRILYILEYLKAKTDEENRVTLVGLMEILEEAGYKVTRKTLMSEIGSLVGAGEPVEYLRINQAYEYFYRHPFSRAELKILIDAAASSALLTASQSRRLIDRLRKLSNDRQRGALDYYIRSTKREGDDADLINVEEILKAREKNKKVSFRYWNYEPGKGKTLRHDGEIYRVSPYDLVWNDDRYYLIGYCDNRGEVRQFRVDRMEGVKTDLEDMVSSDAYDEKKHAESTTNMYNEGEELGVTLLCDNKMLNILIDKFGSGILTTPFDGDSFSADIKTRINAVFYGWLCQNSHMIRDIKPLEIKKDYIKHLQDTVYSLI
ncbi:MAG: WYL domain-containing protein [Clostridiales bacterium]|nr:WYL domain-containing protein [Clostridiales bacterium]